MVIVFTLIYILNCIGIFIVPQTIMNISYVTGTACLLLPILIVKILNMICGRVNSIIGDLMSSEEQKAMLEKTALITEKSLEVSNDLLASVENLTETSNVVSQSNGSSVK